MSAVWEGRPIPTLNLKLSPQLAAMPIADAMRGDANVESKQSGE